MSFSTAYATKKRSKKCMAEGGEFGDFGANEQASPEKEKESAAAAEPEEKGMVGGILHKADGGEIEGHQSEAEMLDMVGRIMKKHYSEGGQVANDVGVAEADKAPAEYDDLVLRDDLESEYDGDNSGDKLGNDAMDERDADMIARVMKSRKK